MHLRWFLHNNEEDETGLTENNKQCLVNTSHATVRADQIPLVHISIINSIGQISPSNSTGMNNLPLDVTPLHPSHTSESQWHIQSAKFELGEAIEGHSEEFFFLTFQLVKFTFVSCLICGLSTFPPKIHSSRAHCCHEGQRSPFLTQQCDAFHFIFLLFCLQYSPTSEKLQELCFLLFCVTVLSPTTI